MRGRKGQLRQQPAAAGRIAGRQGPLQGLKHGAVAQLRVTAYGETLRPGRSRTRSGQLLRQQQGHGSQLGGMERLAQTGVGRQGQQRQAAHQY